MLKFHLEGQKLILEGEWTLSQISTHFVIQQKPPLPEGRGLLIVDGAGITLMDSAGAWLIQKWSREIEQAGFQVRIENLSKRFQKLLAMVVDKGLAKEHLPPIKAIPWLAGFGKQNAKALAASYEFLAFVGLLVYESLRLLRFPGRMRWNSLASIIDKAGFRALPIIGLLSFMIGVVLAYQMGLQLRSYGANIFVVDLLGLSVLREFGPLLTAIMVAGRTGSSFTAELGIMKVNQEIDALDTMGVTPGELLLLPRIIGLVIALPLITVWADVFGIAGGIVMANNMLNITWHDFLIRFQHEIPLKSLIIGLGKTPVFALLIASIGCFEGMRVRGNAESIGANTTRSVVLGIFFIIVVDAAFSVVLSEFKL